MSTDFRGQVGIITGAASGLGLAIALKLSEQGVKLALIDRDKEGLEKIKTQLRNECEIYLRILVRKRRFNNWLNSAENNLNELIF